MRAFFFATPLGSLSAVVKTAATVHTIHTIIAGELAEIGARDGRFAANLFVI